MPVYEFTTPEGRIFEMTSESELSLEQLTAYTTQFTRGNLEPTPEPEYAVQHQKPTFLTAGADPSADYLSVLGRRLSEAGSNLINAPSALGQVFTGNNRGGRFGAALDVLKGVGAPFSAVASPITSGIESGAKALGVDPALAESIGDVSEIPLSFGFGIAASTGRLGKYGETAAKWLGAARPKDFVSRVQHGDSQLAYAASRNMGSAANPVEQLATRHDQSMADLAMSARSPALAQLTLQQSQLDADRWLAHVKAGDPTYTLPPVPNYTFNDFMEFSKGKGDAGILSTLGTGSQVSMRTNPLAGAAQYEMTIAEIAKNEALKVKGARIMSQLGARGADTIKEAIKLENAGADRAAVLNNPNIKQDVQEVFEFLEDKFDVDTAIVKPHLIDQYRPYYERQVMREMTLPGHEMGYGVDMAVYNAEVEARLLKKFPANWNIKNHLHKILPGDYQAIDKVTGQQLGATFSELEMDSLIHRLVKEDGVNAKDIVVHHKTHWDHNYLKEFQGRTKKMMENLSQSGSYDEAKILAAAEGDFGFTKQPTNFWKGLAEGKGQKQFLTTDMMKILNVYDAQIERMLSMSELQKKALPLMNELQKRGYPRLVEMMKGSMQALNGHQSTLSKLVDNTLAATPGLNKITAPFFLDRWLGGTKTAILAGYLRLKPMYHALNLTQIFQTLAPIASGDEIYRGIKLLNSAEGKALLKQHNVFGQMNAFETGAGTIGGKFKQTMDRVLGASERFNQEVAFLTMYDVARRLGLDDGRAAIYGKLRGQVYSQFLGLTTDTPSAWRAIDPMGVITMFQRYPVKQAEMLFDLIKDKNFPGAAKWMAANLLLGGMKASVLGNSGWLTYETWKGIKEKYGQAAADVVHSGLPGLLGIDLSQSVLLFNPPFGDSWQERIGNAVGGVIGSTVGSVLGAGMTTQGAVEPEASDRMFNALIQTIPVARELDALSRLWTGDYDFRDAIGRLKYKADARDVIVRMLGGKSIHEGTLDTYIDAMMGVRQSRDSVLDYVAGTYGQTKITGIALGPKLEAAIRKEVDDWNSLWPEFPITGTDIRKRAKSRMESSMQQLQQRMLEGQPKAIKQSPLFEDFRGLRNGGG